MDIHKEWVPVAIDAPFYTNAALSKEVENLWMVFHGYGQLGEHFMRRFNIYDKEKHHIVACQGLSRFYLDNTYEKVGASWMTRLEREADITHQQRYISAVYENRLMALHQYDRKVKHNYFAFSQGGATLLRWMKAYQPKVDHLILWAADVPKEFTLDDFSFLKKESKLTIVFGENDPFRGFINIEWLNEIVENVDCKAEFITFDGGHHVRRDVLKKIDL